MTTQRLVFVLILALMALSMTTWVEAVMTPKAQFLADSKAAQARYASDKNLCNEETEPRIRVRCRRDAKTKYNRAMAQAKATLNTANARGFTPAAVACAECGRVASIAEIEKPGEGGAAGIIGGGAAGAILGNQVGSGTGKDIATIAGAVGGAYAGKKIEERVRTHTVWNVGVEYDDGSRGNVEFDRDPGFKVGDAVKRSGDTLVK